MVPVFFNLTFSQKPKDTVCVYSRPFFVYLILWHASVALLYKNIHVFTLERTGIVIFPPHKNSNLKQHCLLALVMYLDHVNAKISSGITLLVHIKYLFIAETLLEIMTNNLSSKRYCYYLALPIIEIGKIKSCV